ncbi:MAG: ATP-binding protein [Desulfotignum sp.]
MTPSGPVTEPGPEKCGPFSWDTFLDRHRNRILSEWRHRLHAQVSPRYSRRPEEELSRTTSDACNAFCRLLADNDYARINHFISEITRIRLEAGFPLADVQKAFELFREIVIPILVVESPRPLLCRNIEAVNQGLAYTIHRFSSHFQKMHETYLKDYARHLEKDVAARTAELKESEQQYRRLVEEIQDGYLVLSGERIEYVNPAFCRLHGVTPDQALQQSFPTFVAAENRDRVRQIITGMTADGTEPEAFEYLRRTRDGTCLPTEINFKPSWFKGRAHHLCIVRDITRRVEMEKKSRKMERMAYIGHLTASLSHEIRNPLSSVKMNLQILGKNQAFTGNDKRRLAISEREIHRLETILQQLLDFAKPMTLDLAETDLNQVIERCTELLEVKLTQQNICCTIQTDAALPCILADRSRLEQLVINLLLNALDSIGDGGTLVISTTVRHLDTGVFAVIRVQDDGKGISGEALPYIFEPFFTTKTIGTGLGLANVKQIATAHQGRVEVVDIKPRGTAFEVLLPVKRPILQD